MIVGFTILDFKGHQEEAVEYINKVCLLEDATIARNIVEAGTGVNIFSRHIITEELSKQPFVAVPIEVEDGSYLLVSAVNFNLELLYNGSILRLVPTEYITISAKEVSQFEQYLKQGLVKTFPEFTGEDGVVWILDEGDWNDNGIWVDSNYWKDSK